jgi:hypothetical protein
MQLVSRYLVRNRIDIVFSQHGFITEYKPVYQRTLNIYKGIDNPLQFRLINADQKAVTMVPYTPVFVAYDSNQNLIIEREATVTQNESSNIGQFTVTLTDADLRNIPSQYLSYAVYLVDKQTGSKIVSYANSHFDAPGIIQLKDGVYPNAAAAKEETVFFKYKVNDTDYWKTNTVETGPAINAHDSIQTIAVYATSYTGKIIIEVSLDPNTNGATNWAKVTETTVNNLSTIVPITIVGVYNFVRVVFDQDPTDKIAKVLFKI